ncbi:MAG: hypothetical protein GY778_10230 [bacterium]|nr:hypothetical protein [bacterium]
MQTIVMFEDAGTFDLLPLVYWRTVFELRCGRKTLLDRLADSLGRPVGGLWTRDWIATVAGERFQLPVNGGIEPGTVLVNGRAVLGKRIKFASAPYVGRQDGQVVYIACDAALAERLTPEVMVDADRQAQLLSDVPQGPVETGQAELVNHLWDLVDRNADQLLADWVSEDRALEGKVSSSALLLEPDSIHIGQRAHVEATAVIDAQEGPVYIGEGARIRPHAYLVGPVYVGPGSVVHPFSHIYGGTTIGPMCKVAGEIDGCIITGYSNKQHDGFLGHAYVGGWVNIGAGTANSDLKNTYGPVRVHQRGREIDTGMTFFGSIIGDHVKTGIQQIVPTGAVIGFASMVAASQTLPKFVPSFSWLTDAGRSEGDVERLLATAQRVMSRRNVTCSEAEGELFREIARRAPQYESAAPS